jgi:hypothetical protein
MEADRDLAAERRYGALLKQYELLSEESRAYRTLIVQIFGGVVALFAAVAAIFVSGKLAPPWPVYCLTPVALLAVMLFIIQQYWRISFTVTYMKNLENVLVELSGDDGLLRFTAAVEETLLDVRRAPPIYKSMDGLTGLAIIALYLGFVAVSYAKLTTRPIAAPWYLAALCCVFQVGVIAICILAYSRGLGLLERKYREKMGELRASAIIDGDATPGR